MESLPFQYQKRKYWEFYCPICKSQRRSFYWPSPRPKHYLQVFIAGVGFALLLSPWASFKSIFVIFPVWAVFEFFYRARARQSLICPHCGFDPYIYKYDSKLARRKVELHFAEKQKRKSGDPTTPPTTPSSPA